MRIASFSTLLLAAVLGGPALWHGFVVRDLDPTTALVRFLIAVPLAGVMLAVLRSLMDGYERDYLDKKYAERAALKVSTVAGEPIPQRRAADQSGATPPEAAGPAADAAAAGSPTATNPAVGGSAGMNAVGGSAEPPALGAGGAG